MCAARQMCRRWWTSARVEQPKAAQPCKRDRHLRASGSRSAFVLNELPATHFSNRRHSGMVRRTRPGISRFRVRCFASPRNDGVWGASLAMKALQFQTRVRDPATQCARVVDDSSAPLEGVGNAGCPLHPRSRVHLVVVERTRVTTSTPESPGIPARNGFNGFLRALPGDRACLPPSSADMACLSPVGPTCLRELDASVGASGPHDFAVRCNIPRPLAVDRSQASSTRPAIPSRAKRCRVHRIRTPRP